MKVTLLLCLFAVCAVFASMPPAPDPLRDQFVQYLSNWGKNYNPSEFNQRFSYFQVWAHLFYSIFTAAKTNMNHVG